MKTLINRVSMCWKEGVNGVDDWEEISGEGGREEGEVRSGRRRQPSS